MSATAKPGITLAADETEAGHGVSFTDAFKVWLRVALLSFGGPAGQMSAVTAAVVGVILNLAVWFGVHVIFRETEAWHGFGLKLSIPLLPSLDIFAALLAIAAAIAIFRIKVGIMQTLLACSLAGVVLQLAFGVAQ